MTEHLPHSISYQPGSLHQPDSPQISLESEYVDTRAGLADLTDIDAMLNMARSGASAVNWQIERCPWATWRTDGALEVTLKLWVWPSDLELQYQLDLPNGVTSSSRSFVQEARRRRLWFSGGKASSLPWLLRDPQLSWLESIGTHDAESRPIPAPSLSVQRLQVTASAPVYGLLDASGHAEGYLHELVIVYPRRDSAGNPVKIAVNDFDVICRWPDGQGGHNEASCTMRIPPGVADLLAECPDGEAITSIRVRAASSRPMIVYYNTCTGEVLATRRAGKGDEK